MEAHRPNWDEYFMTLAVIASSRSTCLRGCIGAVLVKDNRVLSTGYNGSPAGQPHCLDVGCLQDERGKGCLRTVHAEQNAIAWAARHGISLAGCTCYLSSYTPCLACANLLVQVGCQRVVYRTLYRDERALTVLRDADIELVEFKGQLVDVGSALQMHDEAMTRSSAGGCSCGSGGSPAPDERTHGA
jgi:dCMP deaminase